MNKQKIIIDKIIIAVCIMAAFSGVVLGGFLLLAYDPRALFLLLFLLLAGSAVYLLTNCVYELFKDRLLWRRNDEEHHE